MTEKDFNILLEKRIEKINLMLASKGKEYSTDKDRLHNFKVAARIDDDQPEVALWGMAKKHLVSIMDMIAACKCRFHPNKNMVDEKIGDMINYLILLEALLIERIGDYREPTGSSQ